MSRPNRPQKFWEEFRLAIHGPEPLPQIQERECSLAFYAGMISAFNELTNISGKVRDEKSGAFEMEVFRQEIGKASALANLDRSDGKS